MKRISFYLFAMLIGSMCLFTSCGDDDEEEVTSAADAIVGTYSGKLVVELGGVDLSGGGLDQSISIVKSGDATVTMKLENFTFSGLELGTIELKNCPVTKTGDTYTFTGEDPNFSALEGVLTANISAEGTVNGSNITMHLDIPAKLGGADQDVDVDFTGTKQ